MGKKRQGKASSKYGTAIRVTAEFAEMIRRVSAFRDESIAAYADRVLLPVVEADYRQLILDEAKKMEGHT